MIILVYGSRNFKDYNKVEEVLNQYATKNDIIISGLARGADSLGLRYANENGIHCAGVAALWDYYGKQAGYLRNNAMKNLKPDLGISFGTGVGTSNMTDLLEREGIPVKAY